MIFSFKNIRKSLSNELQKSSFFVHSGKSNSGQLVIHSGNRQTSAPSSDPPLFSAMLDASERARNSLKSP
jgi:hypothetical protein